MLVSVSLCLKPITYSVDSILPFVSDIGVLSSERKINKLINQLN